MENLVEFHGKSSRIPWKILSNSMENLVEFHGKSLCAPWKKIDFFYWQMTTEPRAPETP